MLARLIATLRHRRTARERLALLSATDLRRRCQAVVDADRTAAAVAAAPVRAVWALLALRANADRAIAARAARRA